MRFSAVGAAAVALFLSFGQAQASVYSFDFLSNDGPGLYEVKGFATTSNTSNPSSNVPQGGLSVTGFEITSVTGDVFGPGGELSPA